MKRLLKWMGILVLTIGGLYLLYGTLAKQDVGHLIGELHAFGVITFFGFVAISLLNFSLYVWRWRLITNHIQKEVQVPFWRMYMHRMAGFCFSYITPSAQAGGEPVRMALLANDGVKPERSVAAVTLDIAFELTFFAGFIFLGFVISLLQDVTQFSSSYMSFIFLLLLLGFFLSIWFFIWRGYRPFASLESYQTKKHSWSGVLHFLAESERSITEFFRRQSRVTLGVMGLSVLTMLFRIAEVYFIAWGFGVDTLRFSQAFLAATLPGFALLVPIPAGLGVFEGSLDLIFTTLAIPMNPIAFVAIVRARDLLFILIGFLHTLVVTRGGLGAFLKLRYDKM